MKHLKTWLERRRDRNSEPFPSLYWKQCLFIIVNLVLIANLVFDGAAVAGSGQILAFVNSMGGFLTDFGKSGWSLISSAILFAIFMLAAKNKASIHKRIHYLASAHLAAFVFLSVALSGLSANILKRAIGRARPKNFDDWGIYGFSPFHGSSRFESFPSGHSTTVGAIFMILALCVPRYRILFFVLAVWLGMTRVIVGAHYPSDVIAGLAWGGWFTFATAVIFSRYQLAFRLDKNGIPVIRRELFPKQ